MKKKGIAALALAGALAATMVPAFAADGTGSTTVGYTANAIVSSDGQVMVTVPKKVTFQKTNVAYDFNVQAYVWYNNAWAIPGEGNAPTLTGEISVKVDSTNTATEQADFLLTSDAVGYEGVTGTYQYLVNGAPIADNMSGNVGLLDQNNHTLAGQVKMTSAPAVSSDAGYVYFGDTLTYTFSGLNVSVESN